MIVMMNIYHAPSLKSVRMTYYPHLRVFESRRFRRLLINDKVNEREPVKSCADILVRATEEFIENILQTPFETWN